VGVRWFLFVLLLVTNALARPIEIRARSRIDAHGQKRDGVILIHGTLLDDGGAALKRQPIAFATDAAVTLTRCMNSAEIDTVETDAEGHFCLAVRGALAPLRVTLAYRGGNGVEQSALELPLDPQKRTLAIRIAPTPLLVLLDETDWKLEAFVSSQDVGPPRPERAAELLLLSEDKRVLAKGTTDEAGRMTFRLDPTELGAPGPGELAIRYAGTEAVAAYEMRFPIERRARVTLTLLRGELTGGQHAQVHATWKGGVVPFGNVECRQAGVPLGAARIDTSGNADLVIADTDGDNSGGMRDEGRAGGMRDEGRAGGMRDEGRAGGMRDEGRAEIRYVPQVSYFEAGDPIEVRVKPAARSHWTAVLSVLLLLGVLAWTIRLRAPAKPRPAEAPEPDTSPTVEVLARSTAPVWSGVVLDAHAKKPLAGIWIVALTPGFESAQTLAQTTTSETGEFELRLPDSSASGIALRFEGDYHGEVQMPAPAFGRLRVTLHSRRRRLLDVFAAAFSKGKERTPQDVIRDTTSPEIAAWVARVQETVYGPEQVDKDKEQRVGKPPTS
jgi:hypothetical protein